MVRPITSLHGKCIDILHCYCHTSDNIIARMTITSCQNFFFITKKRAFKILPIWNSVEIISRYFARLKLTNIKNISWFQANHQSERSSFHLILLCLIHVLAYSFREWLFINVDFAEKYIPPVKDAIFIIKKHLRPRDISVSAFSILILHRSILPIICMSFL